MNEVRGVALWLEGQRLIAIVGGPEAAKVRDVVTRRELLNLSGAGGGLSRARRGAFRQFWTDLSLRDPMRIAQCFSVGSRRRRRSPSRRDGRDAWLHPFNRPFGTEPITGRQPKAEASGHCRMSLRDREWPRPCEFPKGIGARRVADGHAILAGAPWQAWHAPSWEQRKLRKSAIRLIAFRSKRRADR